MTELHETLRQCAAKIEKYRDRADRPVNTENHVDGDRVTLTEIHRRYAQARQES